MRQTIGQMRMDQADYARDSKKEGAMCAYGLCTASHDSLKEHVQSGLRVDRVTARDK